MGCTSIYRLLSYPLRSLTLYNRRIIIIGASTEGGDTEIIEDAQPVHKEMPPGVRQPCILIFDSLAGKKCGI